MIGGLLCAQLAAGRVPGAELVAVVNRSALENPPARQLDLGTALTMADLVVECASRAAVHRLVHPVTAAGADLLVTSVGAFLEPGSRTACRPRGLAGCGPVTVRSVDSICWPRLVTQRSTSACRCVPSGDRPP
ncbi:Rossmann-fold NAD(P)-binding domain-containing protein [Enemella evansiae]|uniref:hypothetical protein n=1 Tax=Enemella evansiae TaxID=2016499 RepID=UPI003898E237